MNLDDRLNIVIGVIDRASAPFERISQSMTSLGDRAKQTAVVIAGAFTSGLGLKASLDASVAFEKGLIGVGKTAGISGQALANIGKEVEDLSLRIPVASGELLEIAQAAGSVGVTGSDNILKFTEVIAKLGRSSDLAGEEAASTLARLLNVTNESAGTVDRLASVIVALGNAFPATEKEIANIATEVARASATFGVTSAQSAALGTAMASIGVQAELGGSAVGRTMRVMDEAIRGGGQAFQELQTLTGMSGEQLKKTFKEDAVAAFTAFMAGLDLIQEGGGSAAQELEKFGLQGEEILKVLPSLASNSKNLGEAIKIASAESKNATALNTEFSSSAQSLDSELNLLSNTFDALKKRVGDQFAPAVRTLSETLREIGTHDSSLNGLISILSELASMAFKVAAFFANWGTEIAAVTVLVAGANFLGWAKALAAVGAESTIAAIGAGKLVDVLKALGAGLLAPFAGLPNLLRNIVVALGEVLTSVLVLILRFGVMNSVIAGLAASKVVELVGVMIEASEATDEVAARAEAAGKSYDQLAKKTTALADALNAAFKGGVAKEMERIQGMGNEQLKQTKELIKEKLKYLETERTRLELEEQHPLLGWLRDHGAAIADLTAKEQFYQQTFAATTTEIAARAAAEKAAEEEKAARLEQARQTEATLAAERAAERAARQQQTQVDYQQNLAFIEAETAARIQAVEREVAAEGITEQVGAQQKAALQLNSHLQRLALANQRLVEMASLGQRETDEYRRAEEERNQLAQGFQQAKLQVMQSMTQQYGAMLDASLAKEGEIADKIKAISESLANARATTEDQLLAIQRRSMSERQVQASLEEEFSRRMQEAQAALTTGDTHRAVNLAQKSMQIANSLKDEKAAMAGTVEAGKILEGAYKRQKQEAEASLRKQQQESRVLRESIQGVGRAVESLATALGKGLNLNLDTKRAKEGIAEVQKQAKSGVALKVNLDDAAAKNGISTLKQPTASTHTIHPFDRVTSVINNLRRGSSSWHTIYVRTVQVSREGGPVGAVARFAEGGLPTASRFVPRQGQLPGYGRVDKIPALLTLGEFVTNALSVRLVNQVFPGFMHAINSVRTLGQARDLLSGLRGFHLGGPVTQHVQQVVRGFQTGGVVNPPAAATSGGQNIQVAFAPTFHIQGGTTPDLERMFRESILPSMKEAIMDNAQGIAATIKRQMARS